MCPYCVMMLLNGNMAFICISVARTLPYSSLLEGKCHVPGRPGDPLKGWVLLQRKRAGQKRRDGQEPDSHQPFILPFLRRSFLEEGLSFPCEVLWFGYKGWRGGAR